MLFSESGASLYSRINFNYYVLFKKNKIEEKYQNNLKEYWDNYWDEQLSSAQGMFVHIKRMISSISDGEKYLLFKPYRILNEIDEIASEEDYIKENAEMNLQDLIIEVFESENKKEELFDVVKKAWDDIKTDEWIFQYNKEYIELYKEISKLDDIFGYITIECKRELKNENNKEIIINKIKELLIEQNIYDEDIFTSSINMT